MIDHAYYPHIIDLIFESATFDSLVALSKVCREWRARALGMIDHVYQFDGMSFQHPFRTSRSNVERYCRVLDLSLHPWDGFEYLDQGFRRFKKDTPALETLRFFDIAYLTRPPLVFFARKLVYGRFQPDKYFFLCGGDHIRDEEYYWGVKTLVINHTSDNIGCYKFKTGNFPPTLERVVFVFHGKETCPCCFMDVLNSARKAAVAVTVVGLETLQAQTTIQPYSVREQKLMKSTDGRQLIKKGVTALTHDEYRQLVGEKEYEVETRWKLPVRSWHYILPSIYDPYWRA